MRSLQGIRTYQVKAETSKANPLLLYFSIPIAEKYTGMPCYFDVLSVGLSYFIAGGNRNLFSSVNGGSLVKCAIDHPNV